MKGIYLATHFDNTYQTWDIEIILQYLREMAASGADAVGFWFDQHEYNAAEVFRPGTAAAQRLERLRRISATADELGMAVVLVALANEGYADQVRPEIKADTSGRSGPSCYPTQLCVSIPEALESCAQNLVELARALPRVDYLALGAYDQGGCDCARCAPWSRTYVRTSLKLCEAVRSVAPRVQPILSVWDMNRQEAQELLDEAAKTWLVRPKILINQDSREVEHGLNALQMACLPRGKEFRYLGFPEISMLYDTANRSGEAAWQVFGANPIPTHLAERYRAQRALLGGFLAYSEGNYEDFNKWVLLQLAQVPTRALDDIVAGYAVRYLAAEVAEEFAQLVYALERNWRHTGTLSEARRVLQQLNRIESSLPAFARESWRWRLFRFRAELDEIVARARAATAWREAALRDLDSKLAELRVFYRCTDHQVQPVSVAFVRNWIDPMPAEE